MSKIKVQYIPEVSDFHSLVRETLVMRGDTMNVLAFYIGINPSNLSRILSGKCDYGVSIYWLLRRYVNGDFILPKKISYEGA